MCNNKSVKSFDHNKLVLYNNIKSGNSLSIERFKKKNKVQDFENQRVLIINKDLTYTCCISPKRNLFSQYTFSLKKLSYIEKKKIGIYHGTKINGVNLSNMIHLVIALISHSIHARSLMCRTCIPTKLDAIIHIIEFYLLKSNEI